MTNPQRQTATAVIAQPAATASANSLDKWKPGNVRARLAARLKLSEALNLVARMLDSFPAAETLDGDYYCGALAQALCQHPREVALACADTASGVVTECMFRQGLTVGRIHDWCRRNGQELADFIARHDERVAAANAAALERDGDRSNRESIEELRERLGPTYGLKGIDNLDRMRGVTRSDEDEEAAKQRQAEETRAAAAASANAIARDYARLGIAPIRTGGGWDLPVSPELAAQLGALRASETPADGSPMRQNEVPGRVGAVEEENAWATAAGALTHEGEKPHVTR
jgi:hypothetical protein